MRRFGWKGPVAAVVLVVIGVLAFGWFEVQKLWMDDEVDEAAPVFDSQVEAEPTATTAAPDDGVSPPPTTVPVIETLASGRFVSLDHGTEGNATVLGDGSPQRFLRITDFATENGPDVNVYLTTTPPEGEESTFDDDYVDLGDLKGNVGDQNYEIPADVDLGRFHTVVIWCQRFDSAFGAARLA
jgi:hypothetical protein